MKLAAKIMKLLDRHLLGEHLRYDQYNKLINMLLKDGSNNELKLNSRIAKLTEQIKALKVIIKC